MRLQYVVFNTTFMLLSINFAIGQSLQTVDVYFEEDTASPTFESEFTLDSLFASGDIDFASYEILIETFPNSTDEVRSKRAAFLADILNYNVSNASKIVHYEDMEHLYFINEAIENWNFIRLVFIPVLLEKIEENQINRDVGINEVFVKLRTRGITTKYQKDIIDAKNTYELKLKGGTKINISPNSFQNAQGELVTGGVVIKTREILSKAQAILADVTTNIGDGYLESKGMVEVLAETVQGETLQLVQGMSLGIEMPQKESIEGQGYGIYEGVELDDGTLDWRLTDNEIEEETEPVRKYYSWQPISPQVMDSMAQVRQEFVSKIDSVYGKKGRRYNERKLGYYKQMFDYAKRRVKYSKKRMKKGLGKSTIRDSDLSKLKRWMVLGKGRYKLEFDSLKTAEGDANRMEHFSGVTVFSSFRIYNLGFCNVDKILNMINTTTVVVNVQENSEVRLLMKDYFSYLRGEKRKDKVVFNQVSKNKEVLIFQFKKLADGKISYGFLRTNSNKRSNEIENTYVCSTDELECKIVGILERFNLEDGRKDIFELK